MTSRSKTNFSEKILRLKWSLNYYKQVIFNQFGVFGCVLVLSVLVVAGLVTKKQQDSIRLHQLQQAEQSGSDKKTIKGEYVDGHEKIKQFKSILLPYNRISGAVQDLLQLSSQHELLNVKGQYKAQVDSAGGFLRYQMIIPVKGEIQAINQYIKSVFFAQKTLALENIKFSRKNADSDEIEARIQWVLFTQLPSNDHADDYYME